MNYFKTAANLFAEEVQLTKEEVLLEFVKDVFSGAASRRTEEEKPLLQKNFTRSSDEKVITQHRVSPVAIASLAAAELG